MYIKNALISIFLFISTALFSQITIDDVGDGWKSKVDSALVLIQRTSPEHWNQVEKSCKHITFWIGDFSTTTDSNTVMICRKDININSINNLACVIIHESHHLYIQQNYIVLTAPKEELECYYWELEFIKKLPNPEVWLEQHVIKCIINYKEE
jgi:hypothetical protein